MLYNTWFVWYGTVRTITPVKVYDLGPRLRKNVNWSVLSGLKVDRLEITPVMIVYQTTVSSNERSDNERELVLSTFSGSGEQSLLIVLCLGKPSVLTKDFHVLHKDTTLGSGISFLLYNLFINY